MTSSPPGGSHPPPRAVASYTHHHPKAQERPLPVETPPWLIHFTGQKGKPGKNPQTNPKYIQKFKNYSNHVQQHRTDPQQQGLWLAPAHPTKDKQTLLWDISPLKPQNIMTKISSWDKKYYLDPSLRKTTLS